MRPARVRDAARVRRSGAFVLGAAVLYLLALGVLRERLPAVPNLFWVTVLAALLVSGGARAGRAFTPRLERAGRQRLVGRVAVLGGMLALSVGAVSVREAAAAWTNVARATGALALCTGLVLVPFGVAVLRRTARPLGGAPAAPGDVGAHGAEPPSPTAP